MSFGISSFQGYVPITSRANEQAKTVGRAPQEPTAGARWGGPGNFGFSASGSANENSLTTPNPFYKQPIVQFEEDPNKQPIRKEVQIVVTASIEWEKATKSYWSQPSGSSKNWGHDQVVGIYPRSIAFGWTEFLPRPHIYSQQPKRVTDYSLFFERRVPVFWEIPPDKGGPDPDLRRHTEIRQANPGAQGLMIPYEQFLDENGEQTDPPYTMTPDAST